VLAPYAPAAERFVVPVRAADGAHHLAVVEASDVTVRPRTVIAELPTGDVDLSDVDPVAHAPVPDAALARARQLDVVLRAAHVVGAGVRLGQLSTAYALERHQFGRPVGAFQAVQYLCTDLAIATHELRLHAVHAARLLDLAQDARVPVSRLRRYAAQAAPRLALSAHEVFAGFAFMMESEVQRHSRRLKQLEATLGLEHDVDEPLGRFATVG
jgi:alkylation response protein AidB-like acyl-CoA dehydrogenase